MNWFGPLKQEQESRRRIWRESQRRRRAGLPPAARTLSERARHAAKARWDKEESK